MTSRVKGPGAGDGAPPVESIDGVDAPESIDRVAPAAPEAVSGVTGAGAAALDPIAQVAARLRAGEISVDQAVELLIDDAVERQVAGATAGSPKLAQELREVLRGFKDNDPFLAARIRRLTLSK